jgi:hypothetical protein
VAEENDTLSQRLEFLKQIYEQSKINLENTNSEVHKIQRRIESLQLRRNRPEMPSQVLNGIN